MVVVRSAETPTMSAWSSCALAANFSPATSTPRSWTRKPCAVSSVPTRIFPISWMSPLVVPSTTTKGDIHEIGKILVGTLLTAHGFRVHDLGVDVAGEKFAAKAHELHADIHSQI